MIALILAYKNLKHRPIRSALTITGVAVAVSVLVSLFGFDAGYRQALKRDIDRMGYQLLVTAKGCPYEAATLMLKGGGGLRYMSEDVLEKITKDARVDVVTAQLVHTIFDPDQEGGRGGFALYMGIEDSFRTLKPWVTLKSGKWFSSLDVDEVIMGYEAAELEQRVPGDKIFIPGTDKVLTVAGVFERTGTQDDGIIFMPLATAQKTFALDNKLSGIGIKLRQIETLGAFEEDLYNEPGIQVVSMAQVRGTILNLISSVRVMTTAIAIVAVFVAIIGVVNTILIAVFERTREIGVMKALGATRSHIFSLIWTETAVICIAGGIVGSVIAFLSGSIVEYLLKAVLPYAPSGDIIVLTPLLLVVTIVGVFVIGSIAGVYPASRAASVRPIEAIRQGQ